MAKTNTVNVKFSIPETEYEINMEMVFNHETNTIDYNVTSPENPEQADVNLDDMFMLATTFLNAFNPPAGETEEEPKEEVIL